jgi:hypothetical protein
MRKLVLLALSLTLPAVAQQKLSAPQLIDLASAHSPTLPQAITSTFDAKDLKEGTAWAGHGPDFFFATEAPAQPTLVIDDAPATGTQMQPSPAPTSGTESRTSSPSALSILSITSSTEHSSVAVLIFPPSVRSPICSPECPPAHSLPKSSTPAKSMTA